MTFNIGVGRAIFLLEEKVGQQSIRRTQARNAVDILRRKKQNSLASCQLGQPRVSHEVVHMQRGYGSRGSEEKPSKALVVPVLQFTFQLKEAVLHEAELMEVIEKLGMLRKRAIAAVKRTRCRNFSQDA